MALLRCHVSEALVRAIESLDFSHEIVDYLKEKVSDNPGVAINMQNLKQVDDLLRVMQTRMEGRISDPKTDPELVRKLKIISRELMAGDRRSIQRQLRSR